MMFQEKYREVKQTLLGTEAHAYTHSIWEAEPGGHEFQAG